MPKLLPVLLGALLLLAGCKGDAGSGSTPQADAGPAAITGSRPSAGAERPALPAANGVQPAALDPRPVLVCFGDSLTAGFGAAEGSSYPDFLQADLDQAGYRYRVVNEGVSGDTTKDGLDRLPEVLALHPAVVVLEFGGNDGLRGLKVETTRQNLAALIQGLQAARIKVMLAGITMPPDGMMQADQTHATERGNSIVAQNVLPYVKPLLRK